MAWTREPRWLGWLAAGLIGLFLVQAFLESRYKSVTSDEPPHIASGLAYLQARVFRPNRQHPPLIKEIAGLALLAGGVRLPRTAAAEQMLHGEIPPGLPPEWTIGNEIIRTNGADRVMLWARAPMLLIAALLAALVFLWGRELVGAWAAAAAVLLCTMDPTILGHSYLVTTDIGLTAFTLLFLFALWKYAKNPQRNGLIWCGAAMGLMLCVKFSAVLLLPVAGLLLLAAKMSPAEGSGAEAQVKTVGRNDACPCGSGKKYKACHGAEGAEKNRPRRANAVEAVKQCVGPFLLMLAGAIVVIEVVYLFSSGPWVYMEGLQRVNADHNPDYPFYFAGQLAHRFAGYFVGAWLLKEPLASIALTLAGAWFLWRETGISRLAKLFLLLPPLTILIGATALADDIGIRYIMPALPFGHLLGGFGAVSLARRFGKSGAIAAAVLCGWIAAAAMGVYPDRLPYFNEAACALDNPGSIGWDGGTRCGPAWLDDSNVDWNQGTKQLKNWLDTHAAGRPLTLCAFYSYPPEAYGIEGAKITFGELAVDPAPGVYAVTASAVARIPAYPGASDWLRRVKPVAIPGHSIYVYDIPAGGPGR